MKMTDKSFFITNRFGEKLEALIRQPNKKRKNPAVLFVSGLGMDLHEWNNSFDEISKLFVNKGFLTLQFSFAGCGNSEGSYVEMTFDRQAQQIADVLSWLKKRDEIDTKRIGIMAQSCGAPSTLLTDITYIKSIFFISGAFNSFANLKRKFIEKNAYNPDGVSSYPRTSGKSNLIGSSFWQQLKQYDEVKQAGKLMMPVFLATGNKDTYVNPTDAKRIYETIPHKNKQLKIYPGGDHGLEKPPIARAQLLRDVDEWFTKTL